MSKSIVGREAEKKTLDNILHSDYPAFVSIYGRRRVGKTFLIRQYLSKNMVFDLTGKKDGSLSDQMDNFFGEYLFRTKGRKETSKPKTWAEAFRYLVNYLLDISTKKGKLVIFLDEMPWMDGPRSGFISALEFLWNQHLSKMDNVLLVACGSSTSWIKKNLLQAKGGLYNRITHRIKLSPFTLKETELFFKSKGLSFNRSVILELYMMMGGIPHYLKEITKKESAGKIINELCFSKKGLLYAEYEQLYHSLFNNADHHVAVIELLSKYHYGLTQSTLAKKSKLPQGSLSRVLDELEECDFITKYLPMDKKRKDATYRLTDMYSLFYIKFIRSHKPSLKDAWKLYSASSTYINWCGYAYENVVLYHIDQICVQLGISGMATSVNSWLSHRTDDTPGAQIDVLIDRADRVIHLCEIKYTSGNFLMSKDYANKLQLKKSIFTQVTKTKKSILTTLITTHHPVDNQHLHGNIDDIILLDQLFK
jgi:hypothetical protein